MDCTCQHFTAFTSDCYRAAGGQNLHLFNEEHSSKVSEGTFKAQIDAPVYSGKLVLSWRLNQSPSAHTHGLNLPFKLSNRLKISMMCKNRCTQLAGGAQDA